MDFFCKKMSKMSHNFRTVSEHLYFQQVFVLFAPCTLKHRRTLQFFFLASFQEQLLNKAFHFCLVFQCLVLEFFLHEVQQSISLSSFNVMDENNSVAQYEKRSASFYLFISKLFSSSWPVALTILPCAKS